MTSAIVMAVLLVASMSVFASLMWPRMRLLWRAQPDNRFERLGERALGTLQFAIGQWRMPRDPIAGVAHIFIFSGFMVVSLATVMHFVHAFRPDWRFEALGLPGQVYVFIKDIFEILVVVGVVYGLWRRLKKQPSRVGRSWEGVFVLGMILVLMLTDFAIAAAELTVYRPLTLPWWNPGGALFTYLLPESANVAAVLGQVSYWLHCVGLLVFLNFLPLGKHFHVITAIPKVFFRDLKPYGQVPKVDLEKAEKFGIRSTNDLSWSMVLDLYSCTECGRCTVYCPTVLTDKPLDHRQLNLDLKAAMFADKDTLLGSQPDSAPDLVGGLISPETIWACTTCGSCEQECPVFIENVPRIIQMRQHKVLTEGDMSPELARAYKGMENNSNPWGIGFDKRDAWAEGLDVPRLADIAGEGEGEGEPPLLYWIGCAGSFDDRTKKITLAMVQILKAAGVPFAILGKEEGCTGDPARRTGNEYLFQALAQTNVELLNRYQVKRVLTHCPHCLHTIKTEYPQFGGNYEVVHHTQLIDELLASGKLKPKAGFAQKVAYHDSCYLGRYHGIYDAPRAAMRAAGADIVELPRNRSRSVCCGAGGGRFWMEEKLGSRINVHRAAEAVASDPQVVASSCPFCLTMMRDGVAELGKEHIATLDVAEIVAQAL